MRCSQEITAPSTDSLHALASLGISSGIALTYLEKSSPAATFRRYLGAMDG